MNNFEKEQNFDIELIDEYIVYKYLCKNKFKIDDEVNSFIDTMYSKDYDYVDSYYSEEGMILKFTKDY